MKSGEDYLCFLEAEKPTEDEDIASIVLKMSAQESQTLDRYQLVVYLSQLQ